MRDFPTWRSMLFVPVHVAKFVDSAHTRGADAYILDMEDSVPLAQKSEARASIQSALAKVTQTGAAAIVRINTDDALTAGDLAAAVLPGVHALMVPKVESAAQLRSLDSHIERLESERGIAKGHTLLIAQIEHVNALPRLNEIAAATPRLMGMILGSEDFSVSAGADPTPEALYGPNQQMLFACRRAGILPFGFPGSISVFRDLELFGQLIARAREMGFVGSYAIHPHQVQIMNKMFSPPESDVAHARALLAAYDRAEAEGRGALEFEGRMVDMPVVLRARELLRRAQASQPIPTKDRT